MLRDKELYNEISIIVVIFIDYLFSFNKFGSSSNKNENSTERFLNLRATLSNSSESKNEVEILKTDLSDSFAIAIEN